MSATCQIHTWISLKSSSSGPGLPDGAFLLSSGVCGTLDQPFPSLTEVYSLRHCGLAHLVFAVVALDEPSDGGLWRAGHTLQESAVVLRPINHTVLGQIQVFWFKKIKCNIKGIQVDCQVNGVDKIKI